MAHTLFFKVLYPPRMVIYFVPYSPLEFPIQLHPFPLHTWLLRPPSPPLRILLLWIFSEPTHWFSKAGRLRLSVCFCCQWYLGHLGSFGCQIWHPNSEFLDSLIHTLSQFPLLCCVSFLKLYDKFSFISTLPLMLYYIYIIKCVIEQ